MKLGFIGLGVMGAPMARHLADAGHEIFTTLNRSPLPAGLEAKVLPSPADVAREVDVVITILPDTSDVERVLMGPQGVLAGISVSLPNTATTQELFNSCAAHGDADSDHSAMVRALERMGGQTLSDEKEGA